MAVNVDQLRRAKRGDSEALRAVIDAWWPKMRRWALVMCGNPSAAEEAVQEALLRLVKHMERYDPERPFGPWLKALVRNACKDELARRGRSARWEEPESEGMTTVDPGRVIDLERSASRVMAAFSVLSPRQREIVELVDLQGHTPTEVARQLDLSAGAVRAQLFAARRALRAHLIHTEILPLLREA